jgi:hypothetical protein
MKMQQRAAQTGDDTVSPFAGGPVRTLGGK